MGDHGLRIVAPESNVLDPNIDEKDIFFSTKYSSPKIYKEGSGSVTIADGNTESNEWSYLHNLGVPLAFFIYYKRYVSAISKWAFFLSPNTIDSVILGSNPELFSDGELFTADYSDDNGIHFKLWRGFQDSGEVNVEFKYYILLEPLILFDGKIPGLDIDYKLKIAKPGYDFKTAKEHQLSFTSDRKFFKLKDVQRKTGSLPPFAGGMDIDVRRFSYNHDLNYFPAFWMYSQPPSPSGGSTFRYDTPWGFDYMGPSDLYPTVGHVEAYVTKTKFYYHVTRLGGVDDIGNPKPWAADILNFIYAVTYEKLG